MANCMNMFRHHSAAQSHITMANKSSPVPVAARPKAWVYGCSLAGVAGSNPTDGMDVLSLVSVVCCQVEVSASGRSLILRSTAECVVSECDR
jgi:hypothetical protein